MTDQASSRIDKWLWHARFVKTRSLAAKLCQSGKLRLNGEHISKSHQALRPGDVLTFPLGPHIRVVKIVALGERRGPAAEAKTLYEDLAPPERRRGASEPRPAKLSREPGSGRPTKSERRAIDRLMNR